MKRLALAPLLFSLSCGSGETSDVSIYGGEKVVNTDEVSSATVVLSQNDRTVCTGALIAKVGRYRGSLLLSC